MGSGKSTLGKRIAKRLGWEFIDTDTMVEERSGKSLADVFNTEGEAVFRWFEQNTLMKIKSSTGNLVVATGGGMPCFEDNMKRMKSAGMTVYLKCTPELLFERLKNDKKVRPLLAGETNLKEYINTMLTRREAFYNLSDYTLEIDADDAKEYTIIKLRRLILETYYKKNPYVKTL